MTRVDQSGIIGKTRDKPISAELESVLVRAGEIAGIDTVSVYSGGQPGTHGRRTGSTRHDGGRAADLQLIRAGDKLRFNDAKADQPIVVFVSACAALGATGIGAGVNYMGPHSLHVGFGRSVKDTQKVVWGAKGLSVNAPGWLKRATMAGWLGKADLPASLVDDGEFPAYRQYEVVARSGLFVRKGPGLQFAVTKVIDAGGVVFVSGYEGASKEWARVDLEGDGLVDGFMLIHFLNAIEPDDANSDVDNL